MTLIAVVLGSPSSAERFSDAKSLLDFGFANFALYTPEELKNDKVKVLGGKKDFVNCDFRAEPFVVKKGTETKIEACYELSESLRAPVERGQVIGEAVWKCDGKEIGKMKIYAKEGVEKAGFFDVWISLLATLAGKS